ncbi:hypothetical protein [Arcicella rosea]|uniref:Uncharacterized protein n=1 Tax=Arcicella rosea TaxID=502909 RepID=A0A841EUU5_9BACT|nr:hypothetical protein [Arcicella rosea]MBB6003211.1 hypothetical protein [Arcicella rosea]
MNDFSCIIIGGFTEKYKRNRNYQYILIALTLLLFILSWFLDNYGYPEILITIAISCLFLVLLISSMLDTNDIRSYVQKGEIIFEEDYIVAAGIKYSILNTKKIIVDIWDYTQSRGRGLNSTNLYNRITLIPLEGHELECQFHIENKSKFSKIFDRLHTYQKNGMKVFIMT